MVKHNQPIRRQQPKNCLNMFDHFVMLVLKGLNMNVVKYTITITLTKMMSEQRPRKLFNDLFLNYEQVSIRQLNRIFQETARSVDKIQWRSAQKVTGAFDSAFYQKYVEPVFKI